MEKYDKMNRSQRDNTRKKKGQTQRGEKAYNQVIDNHQNRISKREYACCFYVVKGRAPTDEKTDESAAMNRPKSCHSTDTAVTFNGGKGNKIFIDADDDNVFAG